MQAYLEAVVAVWGELAPYLLLGAGVAGLLHITLPKNFVRRHLGARGGVLKAVLLGVPLPLCSCGVIPAGLGLKKDGASDGATVGFLISTPQTGVDSMLVSAGFLGWPFALFKVGAAAVTGVVGGLATGWVSPSESHAPVVDDQKPDRSLRAFTDHALMILGSIWGWVVFGVLVSAAITTFVPDGFLAGLADYGSFVPLLAVLVVSVPLYVCATASVPIAAALVAAGMPAGAALVFLMAGPATNVATIGSIYRTLGKRSLIVYLVTIIGGSVALGYLFDFVLPLDANVMAHDHGGLAWWKLVSMVALAALTVYFAYRDGRKWLMSKTKTETNDAMTIPVEGMTCNGCVSNLERRLREAPGVEDVQVTLEPQQAVVSGTIGAEDVKAVIQDAGYRPA